MNILVFLTSFRNFVKFSKEVSYYIIVTIGSMTGRINLSRDKYKTTKCVNIIQYNPAYNEVFTAGALEARVCRTSAFSSPAGKTK